MFVQIISISFESQYFIRQSSDINLRINIMHSTKIFLLTNEIRKCYRLITFFYQSDER